MTIADYQTSLDRIVRDNAGIFEFDEKEAFVHAAVRRYSKDRPREVVSDIAGDDGYDYSLPSSWIKGFSGIKSVEYPQGERAPVFIEDDEWIIYVSPTGDVLRFLKTTPQTGKNIRLTFTVIHTVDASQSTIPDSDFNAVCNYAAAMFCEALANHYAQTSDPTIGAGSVDYRSKSAEYASRARTLRKLYYTHIGIKEEGGIAPAASATKDMDRGYPGGSDRLTHQGRNR